MAEIEIRFVLETREIERIAQKPGKTFFREIDKFSKKSFSLI